MAAPKKEDSKKKSVRIQITMSPDDIDKWGGRAEVYKKIKQFINQQNK